MSQNPLLSLRDDPVLGQYVGDRGLTPPPVRAALVASQGMNTESLARERRLSDSLGIPARLIRPDMEYAEREDLARRILSDPVLGRYAGMSPENAALVRDDEQGMLDVVSSAMTAGWNELKESATDIGEAWDAGKRQMELADYGNRLADGDETVQPLIDEWYRRERTFPDRSTLADTVGLTSATTQLPRMLTRDLPTSALYAAGGALGGAAIGALTGPGALVTAKAGGKIGWLFGTAKTSYASERGSFAAELSQIRDENGDRLDPEVRNAAASLYGAMSAAVETLGEAVFMKLLAPLAGRTLSGMGVRPFLRSALEQAALDKSVRGALLDVSRRFAGGVITEGVEEGVQQLLSILTKSMAQRKATAGGVNAFADEGLLPAGSGAEILEAAGEGAKAALWLSGGPTLLLGTTQVREARRTEAWTREQKKLKAAVDRTKVQAASPELSEGFLQAIDVTGNVALPADAVLELQKSGTDIAGAMGWTVEDVREAADAGQEIGVPLARLHARLDEPAFSAVADIMRPAPDAMNMTDVAALNENLAADMDRLAELADEDAFERSAMEGEIERLRSELTEAVKSVPHLQAQITASADPETTTRQVVERELGLLMNRARALSRLGVPVSETLGRVRIQGLVKDDRGRLVTPEEAEARAQAVAEEEALAPFWDQVWGRLDADSLRQDFPEARRELAYQHGRGLFAKKGEGVAVDELADELRDRGLLDPDADSSTLVERLKEMKRPDRRRGQTRQAQGMLQAEEKNALGVPLSRVTRIAGSVTREELDAALSALAGRDLPNLIEGVTAQVNANQKRKLESAKAREKSVSNGFSYDDHTGVASQIANAWRWSAEALQGGDKNGMPDVNIRRFVSALNINGQDAFAWITVKETPTGLRIYSVELMDEKKLRGSLGNGTAEAATTAPSGRSYEEIIERLSSPVNEQGDSLFQAAPGSQSSMDAVRKQYEGTEQWMKAPNGRPTKLNERQWLQVRTPEFKAWFGDWENDLENASRAVDENGEPLVLYHGTDADFEAFDKSFQNFRNAYGEGFYFAEDPQVASVYGDRIMPVFLNARYGLAEKRQSRKAGVPLSPLDYVHNTENGYWIVRNPEQIKSVFNRGTFDRSDPRILYQSAWHGTPHRFNEFSLDAIGTGEGAQAHGWGLYFAKDRNVSEEYRKALVNPQEKYILGGKAYTVDESQWYDIWHDDTGKEIGGYNPVSYALRTYSDNNRDINAAIAEIKETLEIMKKDASDSTEVEEEALKLLEGGIQKKKESGQLFEVDVPENDVLLDEQKTLEEQPELVKKAVEVFLEDFPKGWEDPNSAYSFLINHVAKTTDDELSFYDEHYETDDLWSDVKNFVAKNATGRDLYEIIAWFFKSDEKASLWLNAHGVKGITYKGGQDGRCFVVFDDKAIRVLDTYYQRLQERASALGSTRADASGNYVIQLFAGANLSTLTHETAHVFFLEMERMEREGLADDRMLADLAALREWTAAMDDDAALREEYDRYQKHSVFGGADFDTLPDWQKNAVRDRAKQEMLARGFEQYMREGKAPSRKLESLFERFRKWLMRVYREARDLHVELTDEVRDVFDRMLAHEEEMDAKAEAANVRDETARLLDALGLKGAKRLEIEGLITEAKDEAAEELRHARDANRMKQRRLWAKEAQAQMEKEQVYVARKALRRTPLDLNSFNDVNGEELGKALLKKLPGSARRDGGVEPEVFAAEHGYESAAAMARDIIASPTPGQRVKQLVDERQADHDALFDADDYLFGQEQLAEQQEKIAAALEAKIRDITAETRYRREVAGETVGGEEVRPTPEDYEDFGRLVRWRVARDQLRAQAAAVLNRKPLGEEVLPEQFRRLASRWMQEERRAILKGDFGKGLEANYKARINIELARQAAERRDMVRKLEKKAKKFLEMKRADPDARFAVFWLAQNVGLFPPTRRMLADAADKGRDNVNAFFARMQEEGYLAPEDVDTELFTSGRPWKGMAWEEFRPFAEMMTLIMHIERESRTVETERGRVELEERAQEITTSIYDNNAHREPGALAKRNAAVKWLRKIHAAHLKTDTIALLLDGDVMGPAYKAIMRPINEATWNRAERLRQARDELKRLFAVYSRRELVDMKSRRYTVPGVADALTKEQALTILLNCGNAGNLQRLMIGQNLTEEQIRAIIDTLDERDVKFAQAVWDYLETFRKESFDLEESLTGVRPEAVAAQPVATRFGTLRGGYYPVVYDTDLSALAPDPEKAGTLKAGRMPSVDHGSMKQRTATGAGTPLALSLDVIPRHVAETAHMLAFRRPVREVAKILRRKDVSDAINQTAGVEITRALTDWLEYVAGQRPSRTVWAKAVSWARKNSSLYTMGFKLSTMLAQMTGIFATVSEIGLRWTLRGVADTYGRGNPLEVYRTVMDLSPMMRNRLTSIDREVFEVSSRLMDTGSSSRVLDPFVRMKNFMETKGFLPMSVIQMFWADLPTWNGAYAKALKENGGDIGEAARYADAIVERTQVGGAEKDLAGVQRGNELGKLMTMFYSYFSALYNLSARRITMLARKRDASSLYRLATLMLLTWFAEPVLMGMLQGKDPDDDDDEDWLTWAAKEAFFNPFNMIIGVREVASAVDSSLSGHGGRYRLSSALDVFDSALKFGAQVGKVLQGEGDEKKLVLAGGKAVGQATGFVNAQEMLILETFWDWLDGTSPELELGNLIRKKK